MGHYVAVEEDVHIYVEDIGEGRPVVFIHGWPVNHKMYEYQINELPKHGYRFIGIDLRGYGQSDKPWSGYDYNQMADDVKGVIDAMELDSFVLAGFSMGGPIALRYMARHKQQGVSKLLLLAPAAPSFTQRENFPYGMEKKDVDGIIDNLNTDRPKMLEDFGGMFFGSDGVSDAFKTWFHGLGMEAGSYSTIHSAEALRDEDSFEDLSSITVPAESFHGKNDQICPYEFSGELQKGIKDLKVVPFENSGHGLFVDEKEKFNQELLRFLKE